MSALRSRIPAVKPVVRTARLSSPAGDFTLAGYGLLTLTVNGEAQDYTLERIGSDFGDGFALTKHVACSADEVPTYHVHLSNEGHTCDCPGGTYRGKCKHVSALVALRDAGRI